MDETNIFYNSIENKLFLSFFEKNFASIFPYQGVGGVWKMFKNPLEKKWKWFCCSEFLNIYIWIIFLNVHKRSSECLNLKGITRRSFTSYPEWLKLSFSQCGLPVKMLKVSWIYILYYLRLPRLKTTLECESHIKSNHCSLISFYKYSCHITNPCNISS